MGDILDDFLNPNKIFEAQVVPTGIVKGRLCYLSASSEEEVESGDENNTDYARSYQIAEEQLYQQYRTEQVIVVIYY